MPKATTELQFPSNLQFGKEESINAFMTFTAYDWGSNPIEKKNQEINNLKLTAGSVALPITDGLEDSQSISWETTEGVGAASILQFAKKTAIDAARGINETITKVTEFKTGQTSNDLASLTFGLSEFREFSFNFKLIPRSTDEALTIARIISFFKEHSLADYRSAIVRYPRFWSVKAFLPSGSAGDAFQKLMLFEQSVVTGININYFPEGQLSFYRDGAPTTVTIGLTMKELKRINGSDFKFIEPTPPPPPEPATPVEAKKQKEPYYWSSKYSDQSLEDYNKERNS